MKSKQLACRPYGNWGSQEDLIWAYLGGCGRLACHVYFNVRFDFQSHSPRCPRQAEITNVERFDAMKNASVAPSVLSTWPPDGFSSSRWRLIMPAKVWTKALSGFLNLCDRN